MIFTSFSSFNSLLVIGRDFGRGGHLLNRANFQRDKHFYNGGRGQTGRMGFPSEYDYDYPYADFSGRGLYRAYDSFVYFLAHPPHPPFPNILFIL